MATSSISVAEIACVFGKTSFCFTPIHPLEYAAPSTNRLRALTSARCPSFLGTWSAYVKTREDYCGSRSESRAGQGAAAANTRDACRGVTRERSLFAQSVMDVGTAGQPSHLGYTRERRRLEWRLCQGPTAFKGAYEAPPSRFPWLVTFFFHCY